MPLSLKCLGRCATKCFSPYKNFNSSPEGYNLSFHWLDQFSHCMMTTSCSRRLSHKYLETAFLFSKRTIKEHFRLCYTELWRNPVYQLKVRKSIPNALSTVRLHHRENKFWPLVFIILNSFNNSSLDSSSTLVNDSNFLLLETVV